MDLKTTESPFRKYIVGVEKKIPLVTGNLVTYINFDNAATTPPLVSVMEKINKFAPWYASIHRGKGYKSQLSSDKYEKAREIIASFVKTDLKNKTVIYIKNTTEAINKLSYRLCQNGEKNIILTTEMEHHSNDLPWRDKYRVEYITTDSSGRLSLEDLETRLITHEGNVKLVTVTGASNVTGYINPIHKIAGLAHEYGAKIMVDGAQLVPHHPVDMKPVTSPEHIDYLAFSAHKMYAPFGTGVLIGPRETFKNGKPELVGGGTVDIVTHDFVRWDSPPHKDEAGSPNIMGVIALATAIKTLNKINIKKVARYEHKLTTYTLEKLKKIPDIQLYTGLDNSNKIQTKFKQDRSIKKEGDKHNNHRQVGIIPFNIKNLSHELVAKILAGEAGIAVRNGCFCAQPYIQKLMNISRREIKKRIKKPGLSHPGLVRLSFGMYNNFKEVNSLIKILNKIVKNKKYYRQKYASSSR